jgi:hypothetical protein
MKGATMALSEKRIKPVSKTKPTTIGNSHHLFRASRNSLKSLIKAHIRFARLSLFPQDTI